MQLNQMYAYLIRARRDLWPALQALPDGVLRHPALPGPRFRSVADLVFHIAEVEDAWLHEDILRTEMVQVDFPGVHAQAPLDDLLAYWAAVEARTLAYLERSGLEHSGEEAARPVTLHDDPTRTFAAHELLWHVALHETRHVAQIAVLLRQQGVPPPWLDLLRYLPLSSLTPTQGETP